MRCLHSASAELDRELKEDSDYAARRDGIIQNARLCLRLLRCDV